MTAAQAIRSSLQLLDRRDRQLLVLAVLVQMATSLLDLLGVGLIGLAGVLSVSAVVGSPPPNQVAAIASTLGLEGLSNSASVSILATTAVVLLLAKSAVAPLMMARLLKFLARREAAVSATLTRELLSRPITFVQSRSTQETYVALVRGVYAATTVVLGQTVIAAADLALMTVLGISLLVVNPIVAVCSIVFFGFNAWGVQRALGGRAAQLGAQRSTADTHSLRMVQEVIGAYREIVVADRRSFYIDHARALRKQAAEAAAGLQLASLLPKYFSEATLVLAAFALASWLFRTQPVPIAAGTLAIFLAAATRVMPALLRVQNAAVLIRAATGPAAPTFALASDLRRPIEDRRHQGAVGENLVGDFSPHIQLRDVTFSYPATSGRAIRNISLEISEGQSVALVGRSGAGKSTLADLILGVLKPDSGVVALSGMEPAEALRRWPGAVAYVPQEVMLTEASVGANVALGIPPDLVDDELVWDALSRAQLADYVRSSEAGLDTQIGERGLRLSGGQRQRLGIARALFSQPRLLVLDEATSALDAETERAITTVLDSLDDSVTLVIIAHRLSTVQHADQVVYLEDGYAVATGSFHELWATVPSLRQQAELMGLRPP